MTRMRWRWSLLGLALISICATYLLIRWWNSRSSSSSSYSAISAKFGYGFGTQLPLNLSALQDLRSADTPISMGRKKTRRRRNRNEVNAFSTIFFNHPYLDYRNSAAPELRIIAYRKCRREKPIYVKFTIGDATQSYISDFNQTSRVNTSSDLINRYCRLMAQNCLWDAFQIRAPLPASAMDCPNCIKEIALFYSNPNSKYTVRFKEFQILHTPTPQNPPMIKLAVCLQPIYLYADWMQLVQFFEIWKHSGAEKIYVYETSKTRHVAAWLEAYEKSGFIERIPWPLFPSSQKYDPNEYIYRVGHLGAVHDCILRTSGFADSVALVDTDEFILPLKSDIPLVDFLENADAHFNKTPNSGYTAIHSLLHYPEEELERKEVDVRLMNFNYLTRLNRIWNTRGLRKLIVHPHGINTVSIHGFRLSLSGYHPHRLKGARLYHIRRPFAAWKSKADFKNGRAFTAPFTKINSAFVQELHSNFEAFKSQFGKGLPDKMSTDYDILEQIKECLAAWKQVGCKVPHVSCAQTLQQSMESWIIYDYSTHPKAFRSLN